MATTQDFDKVRAQAAETLGTAVGQARQPLLAALGAGDLAAQTVVDTVNRVRTEVTERAEAAREQAPKNVNDLREKLDPAEVRKALSGYTSNAAHFYGYLTDRGEAAFAKLREQPPVQRARQQAESVQENVGEAVGEVRERADQVLGKVAATTRAFGEKTAATAEETAEEAAGAAEEVAETVRSTGSGVAETARSTSEEAAEALTGENVAAESPSAESESSEDTAESGEFSEASESAGSSSRAE